MSRTNSLGLALSMVALLMAGAAWADNTINAGTDVFTTGNGTWIKFVDDPIPAGFFCAGSPAFTGTINLVGVPIVTSPVDVLGDSDTVLERTTSATFNASGDASATAYIRALSLKSASPVYVPCPGGNYWDVKVRAAASQPAFTVFIHRASSAATGGTFSANVTVDSELVFTQQGTGTSTSPVSRSIPLSTSSAEWTHQPGSGGVTYTGSSPLYIDSNGDSTADQLVAKTSNFSPGWSTSPQGTCTTPPCPAPIQHPAPSETHVTAPPQPWCTGISTSGMTAGGVTGSKAAVGGVRRCRMKPASTTSTGS